MKVQQVFAQIRSHTILLVDDSPTNLGVVVESLEYQGYDVLVATDGEEALQRVEVVMPDLILLDVMIPGIDGFEVCRRLKANPHTCKIPVIFMTSLNSVEDKIAGFAVGAVDYMTKPLQIEVVKARVSVHLTLHDLKKRLAEKILEHESYLDYLDQEQRTAVGYMNKLIALDKLKDPAVHFYLKPAENFSGDLIAMARTPDDRLHLMLADSTGHGLSAALAGMPMIHPFYAMTAKGFNIAAIAKEINSKVWQSLPVGHFVATILVSIDAGSQMVEVWSGGCPPPIILDGDGKTAYQFKPRHLAMGILPPEEFDTSVEYFSYDDNEHSLIMFSDGVIELENGHGEPFGLQRLLDAAAIPNANMRWQKITTAINEYCTSRVAGNDDIALVVAQCELRGKFSRRVPVRRQQDQEQPQGRSVWQFALMLSMDQIKKLDVVPLLLDIVQQIEKDKERGGEIFLILSEMFNNALDHGVLKLDSRLKHHEEGMERYFDERIARLADTESGHIQLHLEKIVNQSVGQFLRIRMTDSGDGFDHRNWVVQCAANTQRHGRGIPLLHSVCRSVQFLGNGSEVVVEFDLPEIINH